jgi:hypothetical protein
VPCGMFGSPLQRIVYHTRGALPERLTMGPPVRIRSSPAGSAMSGARTGSRAPLSIHCSQRRRSAATGVRSSMRLAGAPDSASLSPTGLSQRNCLPRCRRASCGRRTEWRRAESCARCGLRSKRGHGRSLNRL